MKTLLGLVTAAFAVVLVSAGLASASTTVAWKATFSEPSGGPNHSPFTCAGDSCGSGEVTGLGQADDVVVFSDPYTFSDTRTLTFADGSTLVLYETVTNVQTPGNSGNPRSYGNPITADLTDTIVGGTGRFAGATGSASGHLKFAGGTPVVTLRGTVTF